MKKLISLMAVFLIFLLSAGVLQAAAKKNTVAFKEAYAVKIHAYTEDGDAYFDEYDTYAWSFSGKILGDFHEFDDATPIQIIVGDFNSQDYFVDIAELKNYINTPDDKNKFPNGKIKLTTDKGVKNGGIATYNFLYEYDVDKPNGDTITKVKKCGFISLKWDKKGFTFKVQIINSLADAKNDGDMPGLPVEVALLDDPVSEKPVTVKGKASGSTACQVGFGDKLYLNKNLGFVGTRKSSLVFKGPDKEEYVLRSFSVKEVKTLAALNEPPLPVAVNDSIETPYGTEVNIPVAENDVSEIEDDELTVFEITEAPNNGTATISADGTTIDYFPPSGFIGKDSFEYTIVNLLGKACSTPAKVLVYVGIKDPNKAPFAVDDSVETPVDTPVTIDATANDIDQNGDEIELISATQPENGTVAIVGGQLVFTPFTGFVCEDSDSPEIFDYMITDGNGGISTGSVLVFVGVTNDNLPPVGTADTVSVEQDSTETIDVLANDSDPDSDILEIEAVGEASNGTVSTDGSEVEYTPDFGFSGTDSFSYIVSDGNGGSAVGTVTVNINTNPVAWIDKAVTNINTPVTIAVLDNDYDLDDDTLAIESVTKPLHGNAVIVGNTIVYTPAQGYQGFDEFSYVITDGREGSATGDVAVYVGIPYANNAPVAVDDAFVVDAGFTTNLDVLNNDTDADVPTILTVMAMSHPKNGTVETNELSIDYTPRDGFTGNDSFTYTISDGRGGTSTATVTLIVNTPPLVMPDTATTVEGTMVSINVLANDVDVEGDAMALTAVTQPANGTAVINGSSVEYTPNAAFTGTDTFTYTNTDSNGLFSIGSVTVTVNPKSNKDFNAKSLRR